MSLSNILNSSKLNGIILTDEEKRLGRYVNEVTNLLMENEWDWFLTLTFKHPVRDRITVSKTIEKFLNNLSEKAFGSRSKKRIVSFSVIEVGSFDDSLHVHMMIQDPTGRILNDSRINRFELRDAVIESWLAASSSAGNPALSSSGDEWLKRIDNVRSTVGYMLKQLDLTQRKSNDVIVWDQLSLSGRNLRPN